MEIRGTVNVAGIDAHVWQLNEYERLPTTSNPYASCMFVPQRTVISH
jgi:hypothetical protein